MNLTPAEIDLARGLVATIIKNAGRGSSVPHAFVVTAVADATGLPAAAAAALIEQAIPDRRPISFTHAGVEYRMNRDGCMTIDARAIRPDRFTPAELAQVRELCARLILASGESSMGYIALVEQVMDVTGLPARQVHRLVDAALPQRPVPTNVDGVTLNRFGFDGVTARHRRQRRTHADTAETRAA